MTLQKLIDQQRTAVRDAAALGALAVTLRNGVSIEKEEPDVKITSAISVGFRLVAHHMRHSSFNYFTLEVHYIIIFEQTLSDTKVIFFYFFLCPFD